MLHKKNEWSFVNNVVLCRKMTRVRFSMFLVACTKHYTLLCRFVRRSISRSEITLLFRVPARSHATNAAIFMTLFKTYITHDLSFLVLFFLILSQPSQTFLHLLFSLLPYWHKICHLQRRRPLQGRSVVPPSLLVESRCGKETVISPRVSS